MKLIPPKIEDIKYFFISDVDLINNESILEIEKVKQNILHYLINLDKDQIKIFLKDENYGSSWGKIKDEVDELVLNKLKEIEIKNKEDLKFNNYTFQVVKKVTKIIKEDYVIELYSNSKDKKSFYNENIKLQTKTESDFEYEKLIKEIDEFLKSS